MKDQTEKESRQHFRTGEPCILLYGKSRFGQNLNDELLAEIV